MTTHTRTRRVSPSAYYLGRPAALWLTALAPPADDDAPISSRPVRHKAARRHVNAAE